MNEKRLLEIIEQDLKTAKQEQTNIVDYISKMRDIYEARTLPKNERGSNFISKEVFKQIEWAKATYKHPFISNDTLVRLDSAKQSGSLFAMQTEILVNYFLTKKIKRYNLFTDLIHTLLVEGTAIIRLGWEYQSKTIEIEVPVVEQSSQASTTQQALTGSQENLTQIEPTDEQYQQSIEQNQEQVMQPKIIGTVTVEKEVPIVNQPVVQLLKTESVFIDPTANTYEEIQYIICEKEVRLCDLKAEGIYKNLDKVEQKLLNDEREQQILSSYDKQLNPNLSINLEDIQRKKIIMHEYWGYVDIDGNGKIKPMVIAKIGDIIIRADENPYPQGKLPFIIVPFIKEPFSLYGKALTEILEEYQRIRTGLFRGIFDDIAQSNSTQIGVLKGNLDPVNLRRFFEGKPFEFNMSANGFYQGQYNRIPSEVFAILNQIPQEMQLQTGIMPVQGGTGSEAIYGSQASKTGQFNSLMLRELDVIQNIKENFVKPLVRMVTMFIYDFLEPEEIQEITGMPYIEPDGEINDYFLDDFTINISTKQTDDIKASELSFILQTLGNNIPLEMTKIIMSKIAELKDMPDLAQTILQYNPQPDPIQQQMAMLQLEKLKAEIQKIYAEAGVKQSEIQTKLAQAENLKAKANEVNLSNIEKKEGLDYQKQVALLREKYNLELSKLREQMLMKNTAQPKPKLSINNVGMGGSNKKQGEAPEEPEPVI